MVSIGIARLQNITPKMEELGLAGSENINYLEQLVIMFESHEHDSAQIVLSDLVISNVAGYNVVDNG